MRSIRRVIRVRKQDSVFVYWVLESHEGIASYSTLDFKQGDLYRDLELRIPPDYVEEVNALLFGPNGLGDIIDELKDN